MQRFQLRYWKTEKSAFLKVIGKKKKQLYVVNHAYQSLFFLNQDFSNSLYLYAQSLPEMAIVFCILIETKQQYSNQLSKSTKVQTKLQLVPLIIRKLRSMVCTDSEKSDSSNSTIQKEKKEEIFLIWGFQNLIQGKAPVPESNIFGLKVFIALTSICAFLSLSCVHLKLFNLNTSNTYRRNNISMI